MHAFNFEYNGNQIVVNVMNYIEALRLEVCIYSEDDFCVGLYNSTVTHRELSYNSDFVVCRFDDIEEGDTSGVVIDSEFANVIVSNILEAFGRGVSILNVHCIGGTSRSAGLVLGLLCGLGKHATAVEMLTGLKFSFNKTCALAIYDEVVRQTYVAENEANVGKEVLKGILTLNYNIPFDLERGRTFEELQKMYGKGAEKYE